MKSSVEVLEDNKVKVYVEIEEDEFDKDVDRAFKLIAKEVKLPGFRNGKAPRRVLEARIGTEAAREQAIRDAVPEYLARAVREHNVDLIAQPEVEITDGQEAGPVEFDATCEIRPVISVAGYDGLRVELPSVDVSDDDVREAQEQELAREATLETVDRPAEDGDFLVLDLAAERDGEEVLGLNTEDWSYELGQGWVADDFDEKLAGVSAGDVIEFTSTPKGTDEPADFTVTVQTVQTRGLPELTDEWVDENVAEFATVDEWTENLRDTLSEQKLNVARQEASTKINEALAELVEIEPPDAMVRSDMGQRAQTTMQQFQAQGIDFAQWMEATGQSAEDFIEGMRPQSELAVKVDLALRAVATAEELEAGDSDLEGEYARLAMQYGQKAKDIRKAYEANDAVDDLRVQIEKSKAFDHIVNTATYVDEDGTEIDRDLLIGRDDADDSDDAGAADASDTDDSPDPDSDTPDPDPDATPDDTQKDD
ncbi:MAG: trigger factor [Actinomycetota bacterium]